MSRVIKFRVWYPEYKEMDTIKSLYFFEENSIDEIPEDTDRRGMIIMQFTGLKDMHGKEVYEGDIIQRPGVGVPMFVRWNEREARFDLTREPDNFKSSMLWWTQVTDTDYEVLGNIYENPELLEQEQS